MSVMRFAYSCRVILSPERDTVFPIQLTELQNMLCTHAPISSAEIVSIGMCPIGATEKFIGLRHGFEMFNIAK